jgi:hypothetical protein
VQRRRRSESESGAALPLFLGGIRRAAAMPCKPAKIILFEPQRHTAQLPFTLGIRW